jgi:hypothetical protein
MTYYNISCVCDDIPRHRHKRKSLHRHQQQPKPNRKKNLKARRIGSIIIRRPEKERVGAQQRDDESHTIPKLAVQLCVKKMK